MAVSLCTRVSARMNHPLPPPAVGRWKMDRHGSLWKAKEQLFEFQKRYETVAGQTRNCLKKLQTFAIDNQNLKSLAAVRPPFA